MNRYYLRLEGVNFSSFISDTQDLSTIRGGGLLLLEAAQRVLALDEGLAKVGMGASSGLYSFLAADDREALARRRRVAAWLRGDEQLRHATFVVDVLRASGDFQRDKESLLALNRWRQMAAPSVAMPAPAADGAEPCALDRLRPARARRIHDGAVSESAWQRREHGRERKQTFYRDETGIDVTAGFSLSLEDLARDPSRGNLDGKMAVIYLDGNAFGRLNPHVASPDDQRALDAYLQGERRAVLRQIVERALELPALSEGEHGRLRLETLLWGGDEIAWVVPAWAGWWVVDLFFRREWHYQGERLTHACGVIFCHHKAPIHRMRALAEDLAGLAKAKSRDEDLVAYEVLESYDDVGESLERYRGERCPKGIDATKLVLDPRRIQSAVRAFTRLRGELPARQLHAAAQALTGEARQKPPSPRARVEPWLPESLRPALEELLGALGAIGGERVAWFHLSQLRDYLEGIEASRGQEENADG